MKRLHLHIGSYKTGTSSIQETLRQNEETLLEQGFKYIGNEGKHHKFFFVTGAKKEDWPREYRSTKVDRLKKDLHIFFEELEADFNSNSSEQVISTEYLFFSNLSYVEKVYKYLSKFFNEIIVYVFLRSPVSYYKSFQQQMLKGRSFIKSPESFCYDFKKVICSWRDYFPVKVFGFNKEKDSAKVFNSEIGLDISPVSRTNRSMSIEKMALVEKIQRNLYANFDDILKPHLYTLIRNFQLQFTTKPTLREWVKPVIYQNHYEELRWLKKEYGIDFLNEELEKQEVPSTPTFKNGKATVRDVYKVPSEETVEKYEALVVDALLKKLVQDN